MIANLERVLAQIKSDAEKVRNQRYYVVDGILIWAEYNFDRPAMSIQVDECSFLRDIDNAVVTLEFGMSTPNGAVVVDRQSWREMAEDAITIFTSLVKASIPGSADELIHRMDPNSDRLVSWHDAVKKCQGIIASVYIEY